MIVKKHSSFLFILIVVLTFSFIGAASRVSADVKPIEQVQDKLKGISEEERNVLQNLFKISQQIEELERQEKEASREAESVQIQVKGLEKEIEKFEKDYNEKRKVLEMVLVSYQKNGPASYLETLLKAENLTTFLRNINILRDFTRNLDELLASIEAGKGKLTKDKGKLTSNIAKLDGKKKSLQEALDKQRRLKNEQEAYLSSFSGKKEYYEGQLQNLELMWKESKVIFSELMGDFSEVVQGGNFPQSQLNLKYNLPLIKGTVYQDSFNNIFKEHPRLSQMIFHFHEDKIEIELPEKHLILKGKFVVDGKSTFKLRVDKGSFYNIPLEASSIEELFKNGDMIIDIKDLAGSTLIFNIYIQDIQVREGYLEFEVKTGF